MSTKSFRLVLGAHIQNVLSWLREEDRTKKKELSAELDKSFEELKSFPAEEMTNEDRSTLRLMEEFLESLKPKALSPNLYRDSVKKRILAKFKAQNSSAGQIIMLQWITGELLLSLNPTEKNELQEAISELERDGLIEHKGPNIAITQKGVDQIY